VRLVIIDDDIGVLKSINIAIRTRRPHWHADTLLHCVNIRGRMAAHHYDVVLSDIQMPGMSGIALLPAVKIVAPMTPVVFLTGYSDRHAAAAWDLGAFAVLDKPVDLNLLFETLEAAARCRVTKASASSSHLHGDLT
jgi:DNA-binding NtrC family response regulator